MPIGGNPDEIRAEAARVRGWAESLEGTADRVRTGHGVTWVGTAGDRYRDRLREHARDVTDRRDELRDLARALDRLAEEVEERQAAIRRAAAVVEEAVDSARGTLGRLWGVGRDLWTAGEREAEAAARRVIDTVGELPPPGSPRWVLLHTVLRP
ncbi:WXG100 family type VII secretion target [Actinotalea sp. C106]|uniref:WXG100 family type VII secretion target n=1 Tax=Actinotalea sp. C106 TaxID=2908644 RepID=UPI002028D3CE|nr:WXG100 family type VII secretion target [Actinotalea sp. C106]